MRSFILRCVIVVLVTLLWVDFTGILLNSTSQSLQKRVRENLRNRIESAGIPPKLTVGEEIMHASVVLLRFYEQRIYSPAWINDEGPIPQIYTLINVVSEADKEGLRPQDYHQDKIKAILREVRQSQEKKRPFSIRRLVDLDLLLTDAFLIYGSHLIAGKVDPEKIAIEDILPLIRKDISHLEKQKIRIFQGWGAEEEEVDPENIDWEKVDAKSFHYRLRQDIGPWNALGRVKFMFPNTFSVYFHDTPSKELFAKTSRTFSSGCIRIEKPIELAVYLLQDDPSWTRENILAAIDRGAEQTIRLKEPVLVHLLYWTAWAEEDGSIQFRNDIYSRDKRLYEALGEKSPTSLEVK